MSTFRPKLSKIVANQLPEFVRDDYPSFVAFLEAYYEFLENNTVDVYKARDIDQTLDSFIKHFKSELSYNLPSINGDQKFILSRIKDQYLAKGSEASYKLLFKLLFDKNVNISYPGKQILRASDGKWNQDVSIFARVNFGDPNDIVGKVAEVVTPEKRIKILIDRRQDVEIEVDGFKQVSENIYEFYIDRRFFGDIPVGASLRYGDNFSATILPSLTKVEVLQGGKYFSPGQLFEIRNGSGIGALLKIKSVDSNGGILSSEFIRYGVGYETDFTTTILAAQPIATTAFSTLNIKTDSNAVTSINVTNGGTGYVSAPSVTLVGGGFTSPATILSATIENGSVVSITINTHGLGYTSTPTVSITGGGGTGATATAVVGKHYSVDIANTIGTFDEQGWINYSDYSADVGNFWTGNTNVSLNSLIYYQNRLYTVTTAGKTSTTPPVHTSGSVANGTAILQYTRVYGPAFDGSYTGEVARQFYYSSAQSAVDPAEYGIIKASIGSVSRYPGYYSNNDGFLDDAMFIQDSKYYQAYSYVLQIDEKLSAYKSAVKSLVHPSGLALFGEYSISNEFDIGSTLEFLAKILVVSAQDEAQLTAEIYAKDVSKPLDDEVTAADEKKSLDFVKGTFSETIGVSNIGNYGSITWNHIDSSSGTPITFSSMPLYDLSNWKLVNDSISYTDTIALNNTKTISDSLTITETISITTSKSIAESQAVYDFTTYTTYYGVGNESQEYFLTTDSYVEQTPLVTVTKL